LSQQLADLLQNINCSIQESMERFQSVIELALNDNIPVRGYLSCVVACPYEGPIAPAVVADLAEQYLKLGCYQVSLGDTIGVGTPASVGTMLDAVLEVVSPDNLAVHFHDTL
jgi:hydroxymethylglutaryl-CoA lyase